MIKGMTLEERIEKDAPKIKGGRFPAFVRHYLCSMVTLTGWCTGPSHPARIWLIENGYAELGKQLSGLQGLKVTGRAYESMLEYYDTRELGTAK